MPVSGHVNISVYDITGKKSGTLVDQNLSPGTFETVFDASGLSSGMYFYRIHAGDFVQTKKMSLVK